MKIQTLSKIALISASAGLIPSLALAQVPSINTLTEVVSAGPVPIATPWSARAAVGSESEQPSAHARCLSGESKRKRIGGGAGAVVGGIAGRKIAGKGDRTKGTVVGAAIGGLAGYGIADKTIDCDPVYENNRDETSSHSDNHTYSNEAYEPTVYTRDTVHQSSTNTYPDRIYVSNHPVYSDPSWGATTTPVYQRHVDHPAAASKVIYVSQPSRIVTHTKPIPTGYMSQTAAPVTYRVMNTRPHHHGKYACTEQH